MEKFNLKKRVHETIETDEYLYAYEKVIHYLHRNGIIKDFVLENSGGRVANPIYSNHLIFDNKVKIISENIEDIDVLHSSAFKWISEANRENLWYMYLLMTGGTRWSNYYRDDGFIRQKTHHCLVPVGAEFAYYENGVFRMGTFEVSIPDILDDDEITQICMVVDLMKFYEIDMDICKRIVHDIACGHVEIHQELEERMMDRYNMHLRAFDYLTNYYTFDYVTNYGNSGDRVENKLPVPVTPPNCYPTEQQLEALKAINYYDIPSGAFERPHKENVEKLAVSTFIVMGGKVHTCSEMKDGHITIDDGTVLKYDIPAPSNVSGVLQAYSILKFYKMDQNQLVDICEKIIE